MDHASLPDHVTGDYRAGRVGYLGFGGHAETGIPGVHHPPRRGRGCLPRGDFRRGGGAVGQAFGENDDFGDTSALLITLESEDKTYRELQRYMETLEDRLRRIESVSNLRRYGVQNEQISVYLDPDKLAAYGLDTRMLMTTLFTQGFTTASGSLENGGLDIPIHLSVTYPSEREVGEQILLADADGHMIRLKDVARIVREYPEPDSYITNNGKKAIILSMEMREGHNIVRYGKEVDEVLRAFERDLPESVSIRRIADQPKVVGDSVSSFVRDLFVSIVVVILVMMVLFPFRSALVAATSIPISVFISIGVMYACGIPLNTVTLAALIVVLGMIVDNSIIVIDAYLEYLDKGYSRWYAAVYSAKNYFSSILLATLCICVIFFPLLFTMTGQMLDFVTFFPWTLSISLMVSLAVAMVFIPLLERVLIKKGLKSGRENTGKKRFNLLDTVQAVYTRALTWTFRFPKNTIGLGTHQLRGGLTRRTGSIGPSGSLPPRDHEGDGLGRSGDPLRRPLGWLPLGRRLRFADPAEIQ